MMARQCVDCGTDIAPSSTRCRVCYGLVRRRPRRHCGGYLRIFSPGHELAGRDGYVLGHRLALHQAGIEIPEGFYVHHKNGDKTDNRVENLEVLSPQEHSKLHADATNLFTNQYGSFKRRSDRSPDEVEAERARKRPYKREWARRRREALALATG